MRVAAKGTFAMSELSRQTVVTGQSRRAECHVYLTRADRSRLVDGDGGITLSSDHPHAEAELLELPEQPSVTRIVAALGAIVGAVPGLELRYSSVSSARRARVDGSWGPRRTSSTWAVTGEMRVHQRGSVVPLGWSGRGDGVEWLERDAIDDIGELKTALADARPLMPGAYETVLAPGAAAVLFHEAVGHLVEASVAEDVPDGSLFGRRLGSAALSFLDDPRAEGGPANYDVDDENVRCLVPTVVVDCGVIVGRLHSLKTASAAAMLPTANARAASAWDEPIPRVSNLVCVGGACGAPDLLQDVGDGIYVRRLANGMAGGARVKADVLLAERVRHGRLTGELLTGGRLMEDLGVLRRVVAVADNGAFHTNAMCGKRGQVLYDVGTWAPSTLVSAVRVGR